MIQSIAIHDTYIIYELYTNKIKSDLYLKQFYSIFKKKNNFNVCVT